MAYLDFFKRREPQRNPRRESAEGEPNLRQATAGKATFKGQERYFSAALCVRSSVPSAIKLMVTSL
jgi:hypothetical protein